MTALLPLKADPIGMMMPWTGANERRLRNGLLKIQQRAATRAWSASSPVARSLFWTVVDTASTHATTPASPETLADVRRGLCLLMCAADMFERLESGSG